MIYELSNAVSHVFLRLLKVSVQSCKVWEFPVIFSRKVKFLKNTQIRGKNEEFPRDVDYALEELQPRIFWVEKYDI